MRGSFFAVAAFLLSYFAIETGLIWAVVIAIFIWAFMNALGTIHGTKLMMEMDRFEMEKERNERERDAWKRSKERSGNIEEDLV